MKFKHLTLAIAFTLACTIASMAQEQGKLDTGTTNNRTPQTSKFSRRYDRFEDKTFFQLTGVQVAGGKFDGIFISATCVCPGDVKSCAPETVLLGVLVVLKGATYDMPGNLTVLADGERYPLGQMTRLATADMLPGWNITGTQLATAVPLSTFIKIAAAKKVEMKLDSTEFELGEAHRQALSRFVGRTTLGNLFDQ